MESCPLCGFKEPSKQFSESDDWFAFLDRDPTQRVTQFWRGAHEEAIGENPRRPYHPSGRTSAVGVGSPSVSGRVPRRWFRPT